MVGVLPKGAPRPEAGLKAARAHADGWRINPPARRIRSARSTQAEFLGNTTLPRSSRTCINHFISRADVLSLAQKGVNGTSLGKADIRVYSALGGATWKEGIPRPPAQVGVANVRVLLSRARARTSPRGSTKAGCPA